MDIKFSLNEKQADALKNVIQNSNMKNLPPDEAVKNMFLGSLIQAAQTLLASELEKQ